MAKNYPDHAIASLEFGTPVGSVVTLASEKGLCGLFFGHRIERGALPPARPRHPVLSATKKQLTEYFAKRRESFDLPFDIAGTNFQRGVWDQLYAIPFGETRSYMDIAKGLENPGAVRAVGLANGSNPISIVVP